MRIVNLLYSLEIISVQDYSYASLNEEEEKVQLPVFKTSHLTASCSVHQWKVFLVKPHIILF